MTWLLANWRVLLIGVLALALAVQNLRLAWLKEEVANDKAARAEAIRVAQEKAEALSNELVIQQAIAMSRTAERGIVYVDRIKHIPVAPGEDEAARSERMRAGTAGVRDILCRDQPSAFCGAAPR